jgi:hypothetical protein
MATATLVSREIEEGQRLIVALNSAGLYTESALWIYSSDSETWRLMLTSPLCDSDGSLEAYKQILSVFRGIKPELKIDWTGIVAVSPTHDLIEGLRQLQLLWELDLSGKRLVNNMVNMILVEDSHIYRIK